MNELEPHCEMVHDYNYVTDIYANCTVSVATPIYYLLLTENVQDAVSVNKEWIELEAALLLKEFHISIKYRLRTDQGKGFQDLKLIYHAKKFF